MSNVEIARRVSRAPNATALEELLDELVPDHEFSIYQSHSRHYPSVLYRVRVEGQGTNVRMARTTICEGSFWDIRATLARHFEGLPD
ncbi:MAG: hypothetical protein INF88_04330 [Roseomonas sp.]|nr:hypothetical protein [Roseomonas sp.]